MIYEIYTSDFELMVSAWLLRYLTDLHMWPRIVLAKVSPRGHPNLRLGISSSDHSNFVVAPY